MKNTIILILLLALFLTLITLYHHKDNTLLVRLPPSDISQWYKPNNKRQVWLHTMFNLRRELQAIEYYADRKDIKHLNQWLIKFESHYKKIATMVPQWARKVDYEELENLKQLAKNNQLSDIAGSINKINENCTSCHDKFQSITATIYRAANFNAISKSDDYSEHMRQLSKQINTIKISMVDKNIVGANEALKGLKTGMDKLGTTCIECHEFSPKTYPNKQIQLTLDALGYALNNSNLKQQGKELGTLAVSACASCHGTHRLLSSTAQLLQTKTSIAELLRH
jgi:cytochrome c556